MSKANPPSQRLPDLQMVGYLKALAHPRRFEMVQQLAEESEMSCGALAERFDLSQATVSHHLKLLVDNGVVTMRQDGQHHLLSVNRSLLGAISSRLLERFSRPRGRGPELSGRAGRARASKRSIPSGRRRAKAGMAPR
jgi:ArsR family transcriptional regulator